MILYGFKSCDMVRAAIQWLDASKVSYTFVDYRRTELKPAIIDDWFARAGWEHVFNRNSTSFKQLSDAERDGVTKAKAKKMILANTNFIKRPLLDTGTEILLGFNAERWREAGVGR
jgi:arsenate reductase (glutaredoxin)